MLYTHKTLMLTGFLGAPQLQRAAPVPGRGEEEGSEPAADAALSFFPYGKFTKHLYKPTKQVLSSQLKLKKILLYHCIIANIDMLCCY